MAGLKAVAHDPSELRQLRRDQRPFPAMTQKIDYAPSLGADLTLYPQDASWISSETMLNNEPGTRVQPLDRMGLQSGQFRLYAGKGNGELCDQCGEPIRSDQVGYELVCEIINVRPMNIHRDCYEDWEARFAV